MLRHRSVETAAPEPRRGLLRQRSNADVDVSPSSSAETRAYVAEAADAAEMMLNTAELARMAKGIVTNGDKGLHNISMTGHWKMVEAVTEACSLHNWGRRGAASGRPLPEKHASSTRMVLVPKVEWKESMRPPDPAVGEAPCANSLLGEAAHCVATEIMPANVEVLRGTPWAAAGNLGPNVGWKPGGGPAKTSDQVPLPCLACAATTVQSHLIGHMLCGMTQQVQRDSDAAHTAVPPHTSLTSFRVPVDIDAADDDEMYFRPENVMHGAWDAVNGAWDFGVVLPIPLFHTRGWEVVLSQGRPHYKLVTSRPAVGLAGFY